MKKVALIFSILMLALVSTCFAANATSGSVDGYNALYIHVQGPQNSSLSYSRMPAFVFTLKYNNKAVDGVLDFYDGDNGRYISSKRVYGKMNFVLPGERRNYIVIVHSSKNAIWTIRKNTNVTNTRYNYEVYKIKYSTGSVG